MRSHYALFLMLSSTRYKRSIPRRFSVVAKYGEPRYIAYAPIGTRLHCRVFILRGDTLRAISLRMANFRQVRDYEQEI